MHENRCPITTGYYCTALRSVDAFVLLKISPDGSLTPQKFWINSSIMERFELTTIVGQPAKLDMVTSVGGNNE